jgi:uncharacterized sporulation protein YeaH/YhbH (DUF444 family)
MGSAPAVSNRPEKKRLDTSHLRAEDVVAWEMANIDRQIEALREALQQIEAHLKRIRYALAKPGRLTAGR